MNRYEARRRSLIEQGFTLSDLDPDSELLRHHAFHRTIGNSRARGLNLPYGTLGICELSRQPVPKGLHDASGIRARPESRDALSTNWHVPRSDSRVGRLARKE